MTSDKTIDLIRRGWQAGRAELLKRDGQNPEIDGGGQDFKHNKALMSAVDDFAESYTGLLARHLELRLLKNKVQVDGIDIKPSESIDEEIKSVREKLVLCTSAGYKKLLENSEGALDKEIERMDLVKKDRRWLQDENPKKLAAVWVLGSAIKSLVAGIRHELKNEIGDKANDVLTLNDAFIPKSFGGG